MKYPPDSTERERAETTARRVFFLSSLSCFRTKPLAYARGSVYSACAAPIGHGYGPRRPPIRILIVRKRGTMRHWNWILLHLLHCDGDGTFQLRIVAIVHRLRIHFHFHIRRHAVVLNVPIPVRIEESEVRCGYGSAIH